MSLRNESLGHLLQDLAQDFLSILALALLLQQARLGEEGPIRIEVPHLLGLAGHGAVHLDGLVDLALGLERQGQPVLFNQAHALVDLALQELLVGRGRVRTLAEAEQSIGLDERRQPDKARRTVRGHESIDFLDGGEQALLLGLEVRPFALIVCRLGFLVAFSAAFSGTSGASAVFSMREKASVSSVAMCCFQAMPPQLPPAPTTTIAKDAITLPR